MRPLPARPRVSVFTCVYEQEDFCGEAVESVLSQGWPEDLLEYVVVDDGSTDRSPEILGSFGDRIRLLRNDRNRGIRASVNRALAELSGDVILSVAGDDAWPAGRLERLVEALREHPAAGMVYSDLEVIDERGAVAEPSYMAMTGLTPATGRIRGQLVAANCVSGGGAAIRGEMLRAIAPVPPHAAWEDWWFAWQVAGVADVAYLPEVTYRYRRHSRNVSLGATGERLTAALGPDLRFRRHMLREIADADAMPEQIALALVLMENIVSAWERGRGVSRSELVPVTPGERRAGDGHLARARSLLEDGSAPGALLEAARAVACDPFAEEPRRIAASLVPDAAEILLAPFAATPRAPAPAPLDARAFVVLCCADEIGREPALLAAYGRAFTAADDVTLVIHADGWPHERVAAELPAIVAGAGLDGPGAPDMLALSGADADRGALALRADAVLGTAVAGPPAFAGERVDELRRLVSG